MSITVKFERKWEVRSLAKKTHLSIDFCELENYLQGLEDLSSIFGLFAQLWAYCALVR